MMAFLYPFLNYLQPGILWPELAPYRPMLVMGLLCLVVGLKSPSVYSRADAFRHPAFVGLSLMWAAQGLSLYYTGVRGMIEEFDFWSVFIFFSVASMLLIRNEKSLRAYVWGAMAGGAFLIGYGIYARYNNLQVEEILIELHMAGAYGMYENHNDYSFIVVQSFPYFILMRKEVSGALKKLMLVGASMASLWGLALSLSRGGAIAMAIESAVLIGIVTKGGKRVAILGLFVIVAAVGIQFQFSARAESQGDSYTAADSEGSREELWRAGWHMFLAHPILGVGSRHFSEFAPEYGELSHDQLGKNAHNTYIEILATSGLLGIGSMLVMLRYLFRDLRRPPPENTSSLLRSVQKATLVALIAVLCRSFLDSKVFDLSFFFLTVMGVSVHMLIQATTAAGTKSPTANSRQRGFVPAARGNLAQR